MTLSPQKASQQAKDMATQTILSLSGEGGGYRIEGRRTETNKGVHWSLRVHSSSVWDDDDLDNDEPTTSEPAPTRREPASAPWLSTLDQALACLNRAWPWLYVTEVHPEFGAAIWQRVQAAHQSRALPGGVLKRWQKHCHPDASTL